MMAIHKATELGKLIDTTDGNTTIGIRMVIKTHRMDITAIMSVSMITATISEKDTVEVMKMDIMDVQDMDGVIMEEEAY